MKQIRSQLRRGLKGVASRSEKLLTSRYYANPFCSEPMGNVEDYEKIHESARKLTFPDVDAVESETGYQIDSEWFESLGYRTQVTIKSSQVQYPHGRLLYSELRRYLKDSGETSITIYETGTARGFSALCMARAIEDHGVDGKIVTFDLLPHDVPIFWNCVADCDGVKKTRGQLLADFEPLVARRLLFISGDSMMQLERIRSSRVHFASLDGAHDYENVKFEAESISRMQQVGDVIYFDDYNPGEFDGLAQAVDEFTMAANYSKRVISYGTGRNGVIAQKQG